MKQTTEVLRSVQPQMLKGNCWYQFCVVFLLAIGSITAVNYLVDPYGRYGTDVLGMNRIDARTYVVRKLEAQVKLPELLIFGSSRSLRLDPDRYQNGHGLNVALYAGAIEDHYCIYRYAADVLKFPVKTVVIGLDADLMGTTHPVDNMLVRNGKLKRWLLSSNDEGVQSFFRDPEFLAEISSLLSLTTLLDSGRLIFGRMIKMTKSVCVSSAMAAQVKENVDAGTVANASADSSIIGRITEAMDSVGARLRQFKKLYVGSVGLDPLRVKYLDAFAKMTAQRGIRVIAFYPGYSPAFWESMKELPSFLKMHAALEMKLESYRSIYDWKVIDFRPPHYNGPALDFFDGVHPTNETAKTIDNLIRNHI